MHNDQLPSRDSLPAWLTALAHGIGAMIREQTAMARFQEVVLRWYSEWRGRQKAVREYRRKRDEHTRRVFADPRLRNEAAGPPGEGWLWQGAARLRNDDGKWPKVPEKRKTVKLPDGTSKRKRVPPPHVVGAWFPPELALDEFPHAPFPLPLPRCGLTLPEKYAALAAIHDAGTRGTDKIDPWNESEAGWGAYRTLMGRAKNIPEANAPHLSAMLDEVRRDLKAVADRPPGPVPMAPPKIPQRALKAGEQYKQGADTFGEPQPTDRQAYDQMAKAYAQSGEKDELPNFDTWQRNLRDYRRLTYQQKNKPRGKRVQPRASCARPDQLDAAELPTRIRPKRVDE